VPPGVPTTAGHAADSIGPGLPAPWARARAAGAEPRSPVGLRTMMGLRAWIARDRSAAASSLPSRRRNGGDPQPPWRPSGKAYGESLPARRPSSAWPTGELIETSPACASCDPDEAIARAPAPHSASSTITTTRSPRPRGRPRC
jgi:hypothetical protein